MTRAGGTMWRALLGIFVFLAFTMATAWADEPARYVGGAACAGCHAAETKLWKGSHHALAMLPATASTVLGDFNDVTFSDGRITTTFHRSGDTFLIRTEGPDGALHDFPVAFTFGVYPLQQYLIALPKGRLQAFTIAWDSRSKDAGGQRWYSLYPGETIPPGDRLHWTGRDMTWNYMCADCHSTDVRKNYDLATDTYNTTFKDVDVSCEACHGAGSRHIAWAADPVRNQNDSGKGLIAPLTSLGLGAWEMDQATGIARRTLPPSMAEIDACGGCHARAATIATSRTPATPFLDAHLPAFLDAGHYHPDGQIDGEMFEYGSFIQSRMYRAGVTCSNCHEPHTSKLRAEGNGLCAQCHLPEKFDVASHTHHAPNSVGAQCVNCHMPEKVYMGVDARRDHSIRVPRPDLTVSLGTPNACANCHADKGAAWAAQTVAGWFPNGRQMHPHYGQALAAGRAAGPGAEAALAALAADATAPAIARASALLLLPAVATPASAETWRRALSDPDPLVRLGAVRALPATAGADQFKQAAALLHDPVRAVRTEAARALSGADPAILTTQQRAAYDQAVQELVDAEMISADRPETHLNLGLLAMRQQRPDAAVAEYNTALRLDPKFVPALVNLADLDRARGNGAQGVALLRQATALEPGNADAHHALGLALVRQRDVPAALEELRKATDLAPNSARYGYVYAIALNSTGARAELMTLLRRLHGRFPADAEVTSALLSLSLEGGDQVSALRYARDLLRLRPGDVQVTALIRQLQR